MLKWILYIFKKIFKIFLYLKTKLCINYSLLNFKKIQMEIQHLDSAKVVTLLAQLVMDMDHVNDIFF